MCYNPRVQISMKRIEFRILKSINRRYSIFGG